LSISIPDRFRIPQEILHDAIDCYAESSRVYHGVEHLEWVIARFMEIDRAALWKKPREALLALIFHDAVYVAGARDNEAKSAEFARRECSLYCPDVDIATVARLVRTTALHGRVRIGEVDNDAALVNDCDMSILGADRLRYEAYVSGVRAEYASLAPAAFDAGRKRFLQGLLKTPRIYLSEAFNVRFEFAARENIREELKTLG
jgi:predicted metal-dependent HD superfamily phosphohydrolase